MPAAIALSAAVAMGVLVAVQSRINGELGVRLDDGAIAALVSFGTGLILLSLAMAVRRHGRIGLGRVITEARERRVPWWYLIGGALGAMLVLTQSLTVGSLGVALFTVGIVSGQTVSGAVIDRVGLGSLPGRPLTAQRVVGTVLALVAVGYAVSSDVRSDAPAWMLVAPFVAGLGIGWQQAVNGQVRRIADSALTATFLNFAVGTVVLVGAAIIALSIDGRTDTWPTEPWLYLGGSIGVVFIAGAAVLVHQVGVLLLGLATVAGQLIGSLALDLVAPAADHELQASTVIGTVLTLAAVGLAAVPPRRAARRRRVA